LFLLVFGGGDRGGARPAKRAEQRQRIQYKLLRAARSKKSKQKINK